MIPISRFENQKNIEPFLNALNDPEQIKAVLYAYPDSLEKAANVAMACENRVEAKWEQSVSNHKK